MITDWTNKSLSSISSEFWGDHVDHPLLKRILAIIADYLSLTPFFFLVGYYFGRDFQKLLIFDLPITFTYFTIGSSRYLNGQTIGKRIFKLQVTNKIGNQISILEAMTRSLPITLIINGPLILLSLTSNNEGLFQIAIVGLVLLLLGFIYFPIINLNRQGLHDIIASTQVIQQGKRTIINSEMTYKKIVGFFIINIVIIFLLTVN